MSSSLPPRSSPPVRSLASDTAEPLLTRSRVPAAAARKEEERASSSSSSVARVIPFTTKSWIVFRDGTSKKIELSECTTPQVLDQFRKIALFRKTFIQVAVDKTNEYCWKKLHGSRLCCSNCGETATKLVNYHDHVCDDDTISLSVVNRLACDSKICQFDGRFRATPIDKRMFHQTLMMLLIDQPSEYLDWIDDTSFKVGSEGYFPEQDIGNYLPEMTYSSFLLQTHLNKFKVKPTSDGYIILQHDLFRRDDPTRCFEITPVKEESIRDRPSAQQRFAEKLLQLVQDPSLDEIICWADEGKTLHVSDRDRFIEEVMPEHFPSMKGNYRRFRERLRSHGFRAVQQGSGKYVNHFFRADQPHLARFIASYKSKKTDDEPSVNGVAIRKRFPELLYDALEDEETDDILCWDESGVSFMVRDKERMVTEVFPKHFPGFQKYKTFVSGLGNYEIKTLGGDQYGNPSFLRGRQDLVRSMRAHQSFFKRKSLNWIKENGPKDIFGDPVSMLHLG